MLRHLPQVAQLRLHSKPGVHPGMWCCHSGGHAACSARITGNELAIIRVGACKFGEKEKSVKNRLSTVTDFISQCLFSIHTPLGMSHIFLMRHSINANGVDF